MSQIAYLERSEAERAVSLTALALSPLLAPWISEKTSHREPGCR